MLEVIGSRGPPIEISSALRQSHFPIKLGASLRSILSGRPQAEVLNLAGRASPLTAQRNGSGCDRKKVGFARLLPSLARAVVRFLGVSRRQRLRSNSAAYMLPRS